MSDLCCQSAALYRDSVSPNGIEITVERRSASLDMTTVVSVLFRVRKPDASEVEWVATIALATTTKIVLRYGLLAGDLPIEGEYSVLPVLQTAGGDYFAVAASFSVVEYWRS